MMMQLFQQRRDWLMSQIGDNAVAIIVGNQQKARSKNIKYHFRPDNDLFYFTGFTEPDAVAVIRPNHHLPFVLFNRAKDPAAEVNFGERAGQLGACEIFGADASFDIADINAEMPKLLDARLHIYYIDEQDLKSGQVLSWLNAQHRSTGFDVVKHHRQLLPLAPIIHNNRVVKADDEIRLIKKAVEASVSAHKAVMSQCKQGINEYQLEAIFEREIAEFGCREVSYPSIVAGGNNACCLHYEENNCQLVDGEMLLIDAGAEYQFYCADITRTYPVNGKFSVHQAKLYNVVLDAIDAAIAIVKPGTSWYLIYETCIERLTKGLIELGILKGSFEDVIASESYREFTVHKTGHWLGMDVHDVGSYHDDNGTWIKLKPNMVFTIEPGIYIPENCSSVEEQWRGIGIRIEDDILVTDTGCEVLSINVPRTIDEIELTMASN